MDDKELIGRTAVVTGAAGGLGHAVAARLARAGARVCVADLDGGSASKAAAAIGNHAFGLPVDIADANSCDALVDAVAAQHGEIDILVNNAAVHGAEPWLSITQEASRRLFAVNTFGIVNMCQAALPGMIGRGAGRIINIASQTGQRPNPTTPIYSASKAAVISLTQSLALDVAIHGILVNAVAPGAIDTDMLRRNLAQQALTDGAPALDLAVTIPLGRLSVPDDYVDLILYLASPRASYITGQVIGVNGGYVIG